MPLKKAHPGFTLIVEEIAWMARTSGPANLAGSSTQPRASPMAPMAALVGMSGVLADHVDADLNRQYEGTGLGLPLTKALVEQHGGTLDLQSELGIGTTVKLSVGQYLQQWLDEAQHSVSLKTLERYREIVEGHLTPALGMVPLAKLQSIHIQSYYSVALDSGRLDRKGGLSPKTVLHHDRVLNIALKRARALRLIATNPMEGVKRPKVPERKIEVPEPWEMSELLKAAKPTRLYVPIFLALATGLRRGELLALHWQDVDLGRGTLTVTQALEQTRKGIRFKAPKTKQSRRTIALSPVAVEILQAHRIVQLEERMKLGLGKNGSGLVFTKLDGTVVNPLNLTKQFANLVKRTGIRKVTFHGLRHAHFTSLLREGIHPKVASERAGHASVAITMDLYSHVIPGLQEDAALRIDAALREVLQS